MRRTILTTTAALAFALSATTGADAQYRDRDRDRGYDRGRGDRIEVLAHQIEETAAAMHREAERNNRRPDRREQRMLAALHELEDAAAEFRDEVDDRRGRGRDQRSFRELVGAFEDVDATLRHVERRPYIERGMVRIDSLLREVSRDSRWRGTYDRPGWSYGRRDGRDRDRDDRWDDRRDH